MEISREPDRVVKLVTGQGLQLRDAVREVQAHWGTERGERAFEIVHQALHPMVLRHAYRILRNREDAEDVAGVVLWKVWHALPRFDEERASPQTWVTRITHRAVLDHLRRTFHTRTYVVGWTDEMQAEAPRDAIDERLDLEKAYRSLPRELQQLLEEKFVEKKKIHEIADRLEVSPRWVNNQIRALRAQFSRVLRREG